MSGGNVDHRSIDDLNLISRVFVEEEIAALDACLQGYGRVFAVMDRNVAMQCPVAAELAQMLNRRGVPGMLVDASEETKTIETVMDICGAMALKTHFKNVTTIYIHRDKKALMASILRKNSSIEDKVNRLMAIEFEEQNAELCDYVVRFDNYDEAADRIAQILGKR